MRRTIGFLLVMHGLAHAGAGMWLAAPRPIWLVTILWWLAMAGFLSAGTGLLGVEWLDRRWRRLSCVAAVASLALLALSWHPILMIGAAIDGAILLDAIPFVHEVVTRGLGVPMHPPHRHLARVGTIAAALMIGYLTTVIALRPVQMRWGVTDTEGKPSLVGVPLAPFGLLVFEPAHFIMERGMLRGIKRRAERARHPSSSTAVRAD